MSLLEMNYASASAAPRPRPRPHPHPEPLSPDVMESVWDPPSAESMPMPMEPEDDFEEDETFRALEKLLTAMSKAKTPSATTNNNQHTTCSSRDVQPSCVSSCRMSKEQLLEQRRKERENAKNLLFAKSEQQRRQRRQQRRRRTSLSSSFCDNNTSTNPNSISNSNLNIPLATEEEEEEEPRRSVESTICERVTSGSFSRFSVRVLSRDRWSMEEEERLPIVCPPRQRQMISPAENPKLNVHPTLESLVLQQALHELQQQDQDAKLLTPPRSTWSFQMHSLSPSERRRKHL